MFNRIFSSLMPAAIAISASFACGTVTSASPLTLAKPAAQNVGQDATCNLKIRFTKDHASIKVTVFTPKAGKGIYSAVVKSRRGSTILEEHNVYHFQASGAGQRVVNMLVYPVGLVSLDAKISLRFDHKRIECRANGKAPMRLRRMISNNNSSN